MLTLIAVNQWVESEKVVLALVASISASVTGLFAWLNARAGTRKVEQVQQTAEAIKDQVKNSHDTNLRDDIDKLAVLMTKAVEIGERNSAEIGHLRQDIHMERRERLSLADRFDSHVDAARSGG